MVLLRVLTGKECIQYHADKKMEGGELNHIKYSMWTISCESLQAIASNSSITEVICLTKRFE